MKDVFDLNPDMNVDDVRDWAENTSNPALAEYLRECVARQEGR